MLTIDLIHASMDAVMLAALAHLMAYATILTLIRSLAVAFGMIGISPSAMRILAVPSGIPDRLQNSSRESTGVSIWIASCAMIGLFGCGCCQLLLVVHFQANQKIVI